MTDYEYKDLVKRIDLYRLKTKKLEALQNFTQRVTHDNLGIDLISRGAEDIVIGKIEALPPDDFRQDLIDFLTRRITKLNEEIEAI